MACSIGSWASCGRTWAGSPELLDDGDVTTFARTVIYTITNIYAIRMAGVFMLSLGTVWLRTRAMPRLFVYFTYLLALVLLIAINLSLWMIMIFPLWVLAVSLYILVVSLHGRTAAAESVIGGEG